MNQKEEYYMKSLNKLLNMAAVPLINSLSPKSNLISGVEVIYVHITQFGTLRAQINVLSDNFSLIGDSTIEYSVCDILANFSDYIMQNYVLYINIGTNNLTWSSGGIRTSNYKVLQTMRKHLEGTDGE